MSVLSGPTLVPDIGRSDSTDVTEIYYFYASVSSREDIFVNKAGGNQARQGDIFCNLLYGLGLYERNGSGGGRGINKGNKSSSEN